MVFKLITVISINKKHFDIILSKSYKTNFALIQLMPNLLELTICNFIGTFSE